MIHQPAFIFAATIASAGTVVATSAVQDGLDPTTGWAGGIVVAGVAVFLFMDRRSQKERDAFNDERREDDKLMRQELLEAKAELTAERIAHAETLNRLNERIIQLLEDRQE